MKCQVLEEELSPSYSHGDPLKAFISPLPKGIKSTYLVKWLFISRLVCNYHSISGKLGIHPATDPVQFKARRNMKLLYLVYLFFFFLVSNERTKSTHILHVLDQQRSCAKCQIKYSTAEVFAQLFSGYHLKKEKQ